MLHRTDSWGLCESGAQTQAPQVLILCPEAREADGLAGQATQIHKAGGLRGAEVWDGHQQHPLVLWACKEATQAPPAWVLGGPWLQGKSPEANRRSLSAPRECWLQKLLWTRRRDRRQHKGQRLSPADRSWALSLQHRCGPISPCPDMLHPLATRCAAYPTGPGDSSEVFSVSPVPRTESLVTAQAQGPQKTGLTSEDFRAKLRGVPAKVDVRALREDERISLVEGVATWRKPTVAGASQLHTVRVQGPTPAPHTCLGSAGSSPACCDMAPRLWGQVSLPCWVGTAAGCWVLPARAPNMLPVGFSPTQGLGCRQSSDSRGGSRTSVNLLGFPLGHGRTGECQFRLQTLWASRPPIRTPLVLWS